PRGVGRAGLAGRRAMTTASAMGHALVARRELVARPVDVFFGLRPGDRALVQVGEAVSRGQPIIERYRDVRTIVTDVAPTGEAPQPGQHHVEAAGRAGEPATGGELLFRSGGRWRLAGGERPEPVEAPFAGVVQLVQPGSGVTVRTASSAIRGRG